MTPEEKFRRLRDESLWNEVRIPRGRTLPRAERSRIWQIVVPVVAGLAVAALVIIGMRTLRAPDEQPALPSPTPTSDAFDAALPVDPADFGPDWYDSDSVDGVDFDVANGTIHCGIYDPYFDESPMVGCDPGETNFTWPVVTNDGDGDIRASAVGMRGDRESTAAWKSDVQFGGEVGTVGLLEPGRSITWSTVTCAAIDGGVDCRNAASGHGFFISKDAYVVDAKPPFQLDGSLIQDPQEQFQVDENNDRHAAEFTNSAGTVACAIFYTDDGPRWGCENTGGDGYWAEPGKAPVLKAGVDFAAKDGDVLPVAVGHFVAFQQIRCVAIVDGFECDSMDTGEGFRLTSTGGELFTH